MPVGLAHSATKAFCAGCKVAPIESHNCAGTPVYCDNDNDNEEGDDDSEDDGYSE